VAVVHVAEIAPPLVPSIVETAAPPDRITPTPTLMRVFRPPRGVRV
jgi:hypothetical protein